MAGKRPDPTQDRLDLMDQKLAFLIQMAQHLHNVAHATLDAVMALPSPATPEDKARLTALTASLKNEAASLEKTVTDNPVPK